MRESQKKAIDKYITKVTPLNIRIDNTIYNMLVEYCKEKGYSKKEFIEKAIQAYIDNNWRIIKYKAVLKAFNGIVV